MRERDGKREMKRECKLKEMEMKMALKCVGLCLLTSRHFRFLSPRLPLPAAVAAAAPSNCNIRDSDCDISSGCHRYLRRVDCIFLLSGCVHYVSVCVCARLMHFSLLCGCEYLNTSVSLKMSSRCRPTLPNKLFAYRWLLSQ